MVIDMTEIEVKFRKALATVPNPYVTAKSTEATKKEYKLAKIVRLGANENNWGCSPRVKAAIEAEEENFSRYPDGYCSRLRSKLAAHYGIEENELIFGHGSFELLSLVAQIALEPGDEAIIPEPTFNWYRIITEAAGGKVVSVPLTKHTVDFAAVLQAVTAQTRVIWLCNPNNPTGTIFTASALRSFLDTLPRNIYVVLDEAYYDYVDDAAYPDSTKLSRQYKNVLSLRTFSKVYGLASMRVGYGLGDPRILNVMNKVRTPLNVSAVSQAAALAALTDRDFVQEVIRKNAEGKHFYYRYFDGKGLAYIPTQGNFFMVDIEKDSTVATERILRKGVLVRSGEEFGMPTWLRISIGRPEENELLTRILDDVLREI
jgi:histidinol-phosphate aminotransferase